VCVCVCVAKRASRAQSQDNSGSSDENIQVQWCCMRISREMLLDSIVVFGWPLIGPACSFSCDRVQKSIQISRNL
jgi:hypothetical protein